MNRSLVIVLGALALGAALFAGSFFLSQRVSMACEVTPDNLAWMQKEFPLKDAEMARIQKLHKNYLTECNAMCRKVTDKKQELAATLNNSTNVTSAAEQKLAELAACRAQCQSRILQYFVAVSQVMPPAEGRRYLAEMQNFTLGLQNGNKQLLSEPTGHERHQP